MKKIAILAVPILIALIGCSGSSSPSTPDQLVRDVALAQAASNVACQQIVAGNVSEAAIVHQRVLEARLALQGGQTVLAVEQELLSRVHSKYAPTVAALLPVLNLHIKTGEVIKPNTPAAAVVSGALDGCDQGAGFGIKIGG